MPVREIPICEPGVRRIEVEPPPPLPGTRAMVDIPPPPVFGGIRAIVVIPTLLERFAVTGIRPPTTGLTRVPTVGLTRGATVELTVMTREPICRLGVRMMLCACTAEPPRMANGNASADNAARRVLIRQFTLGWAIKPRL